MSTSSYSTLWTLVKIDFPAETPQARLALNRLVKHIRCNFCRDFVVSRGRGCGLAFGSPNALEAALRPLIPAWGRIDLVGVTDKQVEKAHVFWGDRVPAVANG